MVRRRVEQLIPIITVTCLLVAAGGGHAGNNDASNSAETSMSSEKVTTNQGLVSSVATVPSTVADQRLTDGRADSASIEDSSQQGTKARSVEDANSNEHRGLMEDAESLRSGDSRSRTKRQANRRPYDAKSCLSCVDLYLEEDSKELAGMQETYSKCVLEAMDTTDLTNLLLFSPGLSSATRSGIPGGGGSWGYSSGKPTKTYFWTDDPDRKGRPLAEHFPSDPDFMRKAQAALTLQVEEPTNAKTREKRGTSRGKPSFGYSPGYPYPSPRPSDPLSALSAKIQSCFLEKSELSNATQSGRVEPIVANVESFIDKMTGSDDAKRRMKRAASQCAGEQSRPARYSDWYECFWRKACDVCCSTPQSPETDASGNFRRKPNGKQRSVGDNAETIAADD